MQILEHESRSYLVLMVQGEHFCQNRKSVAGRWLNDASVRESPKKWRKKCPFSCFSSLSSQARSLPGHSSLLLRLTAKDPISHGSQNEQQPT